jgi:hypothetical protein
MEILPLAVRIALALVTLGIVLLELLTAGL